MEYLIECLSEYWLQLLILVISIIAFIFMILYFKTTSKLSSTKFINTDLSNEVRELKERNIKIHDTLADHEALVQALNDSGDLTDYLFFMTDKDEVAKTVKFKTNEQSQNKFKKLATIRRKVDNKYKDVVVKPVIRIPKA